MTQANNAHDTSRRETFLFFINLFFFKEISFFFNSIYLQERDRLVWADKRLLMNLSNTYHARQ